MSTQQLIFNKLQHIEKEQEEMKELIIKSIEKSEVVTVRIFEILSRIEKRLTIEPPIIHKDDIVD